MVAVLSLQERPIEPPVLSAGVPQGLAARWYAADQAMAALEYCAEGGNDDRFDTEREILGDRSMAAFGRARATWIEVHGFEDAPASGPKGCGTKARSQMLSQAKASITSLEASVTEGFKPMDEGLWIGSMKLCAAHISSAEIAPDVQMQQPAVWLRLRTNAKGALARYTRASIGQNVAVRVEGRIVSQPAVYETITQGELSLTGLGEAERRQALAAALRPC